jgi:hypothetical protein
MNHRSSAMTARIYRPAKTAMQSGQAKTKDWVLDYEPVWAGNPQPSVRLQRTGRERKATGTFYTPRSLTEYLVRRTLYPLIRHATPESILSLP